MKLRLVAPIVVAGGAIAFLVFGGLSNNVMFFRTVSEAVAERSDVGTTRFRLAGAVVPGSVEEVAEGVRFQVSDGSSAVTVEHRGDPPELFGDGTPVVCEGRWGDGVFRSDRLMIKHGSDYAPPDVAVDEAPAPAAAAPTGRGGYR